MKTLLALLILIPSFSMSLTFKDGKQVKEKKYGEVVYCINNSSKKVLKSRSGLCPNKYKISSKKAYLHYLSTKNEITIDINTENYKPVVWCKNPTNGYIRKMSSCPIGDFTEQSSRDEYLLSLKQKKQKNFKKDTSNESKIVASNKDEKKEDKKDTTKYKIVIDKKAHSDAKKLNDPKLRAEANRIVNVYKNRISQKLTSLNSNNYDDFSCRDALKETNVQGFFSDKDSYPHQTQKFCEKHNIQA